MGEEERRNRYDIPRSFFGMFLNSGTRRLASFTILIPVFFSFFQLLSNKHTWIITLIFSFELSKNPGRIVSFLFVLKCAVSL